MNSRKIIAVISSIRGLAHELISRELKRHGISGIAPSHGDILFTLYSKDGVSMKEIARGIGKKKNTVTVLVDKLASLGFVRKEADGADRRTTRVFLTEKARAFQGIFADVSETLIERTLKDFGEPEKDGLMTFLDRIEKNLK